jgi:biotin carboxyl carrier protein
MKAIIQGHEIGLELTDKMWKPIGEDRVSCTALNDGRLLIGVNGKIYTARVEEINREEKTVILYLNGKKLEVKLKEPLDDLLQSMGLDKLATAKVSSVKAPMPGLVLSVLVSAGQEVKKGDKLLVLEAMKMENIIKAGGDGVVAQIMVNQGQAVDKNQTLIEFA